MRVAGLSLAAALSLGLTSGAAAADDSLVSAYRSLCFDTAGDAAKARPIADAAGWKAPAPNPKADAEGMFRRERWTGSQHWELMIQEKTLPAGDLPLSTRMTICLLALSPAPAGVHGAARALMAADPTQKDGPNWGWTFADDGARREYIRQATPEAAANAVKAGRLVIVVATESPQGGALVFTQIAKAVAP